MKQYFKIGEISKLYHIGPDSLRYYEELGILTPKRGQNGYRLYQLKDIWRLNVIRDLRQLNFPMDRIKSYLQDRSISNTEHLLEEELSAIEHQMLFLNKLRENVEERLQTIREAKEQPLGMVIEKQFPRRHCHMIRSGYTRDEEMDVLMKQLLNKSEETLYIIGNNNIGSLIPLTSAMEMKYQDYSGVYIIAEDGTDSFPEGTYLSLIYRGNPVQNRLYIPLLFEYAQTHHYRLSGPILEVLWVDIHQTADPSEHTTELQIHVSPSSQL